jgi:hypothetical protein
MGKKTKRGGASIFEKVPLISEINKKGIYIADDIDYNIRQNKKQDLIKKYEDNLNEAKENVKRAKDEKYRNLEDEKIQNQRDKASIEQRKLRNNQFQFILKSLGNICKYFFNLVYKLLFLLIKIFPILFSTIKSIGNGLKNIGNIGNGVIIKTLVLIFIIIGIFFGFNYFVNKEDPATKVNNLISTDKNYSSFLINTTKPDIFGKLSNSFLNLIPDKYKCQFNFLKNKFNSIIGNDIYELTGTPREEITTGKNDGIYHIKKKEDNYYTYTTLKPLDIKIPLSSLTSIKNNDLNNLPNKIKELYPINNNIIIPIELKNTNEWEYNIENIKYEGTRNLLKDTANYILLPFIKTNKINEFKFKKIKAKIFNNDDKSAASTLEKMFTYNENKYNYPF